VHGANQHEARWVSEGDSFPFHDVYSHCGCVEQHIDHVVIEQVDLIDVEDASISLCQYSGLKTSPALLQGMLEIKCAYDAVFRGIDWQVNHAHLAMHYRQLLALIESCPAWLAHG